jgi:histidine-containing phosphotransfer protein
MADAAGLAAMQQQALQAMQAEGLLDEQFQQLIALQDESNPDFVTEVAELYFDDALPKIQRVGQLLSAPAPDFGELDAVVHQFKGSSASLGAGGMARLCIRMRELCQAHDVAGCQALVEQVRARVLMLCGGLACAFCSERALFCVCVCVGSV